MEYHRHMIDVLSRELAEAKEAVKWHETHLLSEVRLAFGRGLRILDASLLPPDDVRQVLLLLEDKFRKNLNLMESELEELMNEED